MRRVRARRGHPSRHKATIELLNDLLDPDPNDHELAAAWWSLRADLPSQVAPEEDAALWAFWPGVPEHLRVTVDPPDTRLLVDDPAHPAYHRQVELAESQLAARRAWLQAHPEMTAP